MDSEAAPSEFLSTEQILKILSETPAGFIKATDPPSPILPPFKKLGVLVEIDEIVGIQDKPAKISDSRDKEQSYSCAECRRMLPTAHLLDLHITEQHDFYFAASVDRGDKPMFSCFLEECTTKFHTPRQRKDHCIIVHKFPANYRFDQGNEKPKEKRHPKHKPNSMEVDELPAETKSFPYIKAFSFGHQTHRTFYTRKDHKAGETLDDVQTMKDAINDILD
ncbi:protein lethal(2)k10201 [Drosophila rhopaloa]|uniref:C2H2-type domain-containing protein n=1 Tax=Drosophila rhopaloa TaxID=1041015 RepID=A0ABM5I486_DRORH|nr:protein lethal(2)k10201 [Drosophila rhopaloa]